MMQKGLVVVVMVSDGGVVAIVGVASGAGLGATSN